MFAHTPQSKELKKKDGRYKAAETHKEMLHSCWSSQRQCRNILTMRKCLYNVPGYALSGLLKKIIKTKISKAFHAMPLTF